MTKAPPAAREKVANVMTPEKVTKATTPAQEKEQGGKAVLLDGAPTACAPQNEQVATTASPAGASTPSTVGVPQEVPVPAVKIARCMLPDGLAPAVAPTPPVFPLEAEASHHSD